MHPNISYALLSAALIVLSTVHLILLTVHRPQPHRLPELSIFVLFICINAVVIGVGLSGLRLADTPAFYYPLGLCTAFPLPLEMIRQTKIQAGPLTNALLHRLFLGYVFLSPAVKLGLILCSVAHKASVKGPAVVVSIDYMVLAIAGLLFWRGIRGIPSQGPVIREVTIHALLVLVTAGFAAGGLVHDWPLWIEAMLIITIGAYMARNISARSGELGKTVPLHGFPDNTSDISCFWSHWNVAASASKVILVLREMALTSDRQLRKRASTQAMQENAEPNKRTDRSQNHDDDQATAHDLLEGIRRRSPKKEGYVEKPVHQRLRLYCCGCEEDVSGGGECRQCGHTSCPVCLNERILRRERSVDPSHKPNQANKHHDAQTNNNARGPGDRS
ncbi:hypothetical protein ACJ73_04870 [Blastomyces percursus]|uniref:Uncharacterized protein n=1 Tax=Blastomyces percursus TaxID=1658174 RepID=A0A1J9Q508_9EURO|nr:hypothetical protein ACJ73_04870 [Blastomyces percursus]